MNNSEAFVILTNRKRAVIALVHSVVFLLIALRSVLFPSTLTPIWLHQNDKKAALLILLIYVIVSSILIQLTRISVAAREKLYFLFCSTSASVGMIRNVVGDPVPHLGSLVRVAMLMCAVATGILILRSHPSSLAARTA